MRYTVFGNEIAQDKINEWKRIIGFMTSYNNQSKMAASNLYFTRN